MGLLFMVTVAAGRAGTRGTEPMSDRSLMEGHVFICPYCGADVVRTGHDHWDYDCVDCGRGWKVLENGSWMALFDAALTTVSKEDVKRINDHRFRYTNYVHGVSPPPPSVAPTSMIVIDYAIPPSTGKGDHKDNEKVSRWKALEFPPKMRKA